MAMSIDEPGTGSDDRDQFFFSNERLAGSYLSLDEKNPAAGVSIECRKMSGQSLLEGLTPFHHKTNLEA
jgi:hypothetical protein